jgi:hypothetical protein
MHNVILYHLHANNPALNPIKIPLETGWIASAHYMPTVVRCDCVALLWRPLRLSSRCRRWKGGEVGGVVSGRSLFCSTCAPCRNAFGEAIKADGEPYAVLHQYDRSSYVSRQISAQYPLIPEHERALKN